MILERSTACLYRQAARSGYGPRERAFGGGAWQTFPGPTLYGPAALLWPNGRWSLVGRAGRHPRSRRANVASRQER